MGALLGILIIVIKDIISDKIECADDIRELDYEVLADLTKEKETELSKIKRKINTTSPSAVVGLSHLNKHAQNIDVATDLSYLLNGIEIKEKNEKDILNKINKLKADNPYILIEEDNFNSPISINLADYEDYKILLVGENTSKNTLLNAIKELDRLGIRLLGVIYYR